MASEATYEALRALETRESVRLIRHPAADDPLHVLLGGPVAAVLNEHDEGVALLFESGKPDTYNVLTAANEKYSMRLDDVAQVEWTELTDCQLVPPIGSEFDTE